MTGTSKLKNKFGKLLKNDFLASVRVISLFYIAEVVILAVFALGAYFNKKGGDHSEFINKLINASNIALILAILVAFLLIFVTIFFVIFDFNKSLFSPQGYLSFTLPVSSNQLLGSKLIVYGGWMLLSYVLFLFIALYLLSYGETYIIGEQKVDSIEMMLTQMLDFPSKKQLVAYAIYYATEIFTTLLTFVSVVYFAISLSHIRVFQKASLIWAVVIFFAVSAIMAWLASKPADFINIILQFKADGSVGFGIVKPGFEFAEGTLPFDLSGMIASLLECVALFFATSHIMHKRVNIK